MAYIPKVDKMIEAIEESKYDVMTCGVELEFLVPSIADTAPDPDPDMGNQHLHKSMRYASELIDREVREQVIERLQQQLEDLPIRSMNDDYFYPPHDKVVVYDSWRLGSDKTISKHGGLGLAEGPYSWTSCKLTSTAMEAEEYAEQIESVCRVLKTSRIHLNKSTAVHVHVGLGEEPFTLRTVKRFATLYWFAENAVLSLHHPSRQENKYCWRLNKYSELAVRGPSYFQEKLGKLDNEGIEMMRNYVPHIHSSVQRNRIRRIWGCNNMQDVAILMQDARDKVPADRAYGSRGSVGFDRFLAVDDVGGNIQTFEWRQMSGSLDAEHINQWIKFCMAFTWFCHLSERITYLQFLDKIILKGQTYTGIELVTDLGLDAGFFQAMQEKWAADSTFCEANRGKELFVPQ
ncbi:putative amidoligase enzyme-domain-containing protein [Xylaria nigripes]|nr:putative amidoligase enzyme-domain-containing protein [Xylaria nigripes]